MTCPPEISKILLAILTRGILNIRNHRWDGRGDELVAEADHIHNLPSLVSHYRPELLRFYWEIERPAYLRRMLTAVEVFGPLWDELYPHVVGGGERGGSMMAEQIGNGRDGSLRDERGPIPEFPPASTDAEGRYVLPSPEEMKERLDAFRRAQRVLDAMPEEEGEEERWAEAMRSLGVPVDPAETGH